VPGSDDEVVDRPARDPDFSLAYGPEPDQLVDIRLPGTMDPAPLVVVVHGGFWKTEWDRAHAAAQSAGLADAGYVVATVEYRRVGGSGGGWPATFDDVAMLTDEVPALALAVLDQRVQPQRTVLVGHSAGGHLALWAASRHRLKPGSRWHRSTPLELCGVVSLGGVTDLVMADRLQLGGGAARALVGADAAAEPDRYAEASPAALLPIGTPVTLVHGTDDEDVPIELSRRYADQARAAGDPCQLVELAGVGHFELIDPLSPAWPVVCRAVDDLFA